MSVPNCSLYSDALSARPDAITGIVRQKDPVTGVQEIPANAPYGTQPQAAAEQRSPAEAQGVSLDSSTLSAVLGFAG